MKIRDVRSTHMYLYVYARHCGPSNPRKTSRPAAGRSEKCEKKKIPKKKVQKSYYNNEPRSYLADCRGEQDPRRGIVFI